MRVLYLLFRTVLAVSFAVAQTPSATLIGRVTDETAAPLSAARVTVTNLETNEAQTFTTGGDGGFSAVDLKVGSYRIVIAKEGFRTLEQQTVELQLDETARLDFVMRHGDPGQRLIVAPAGNPMDTQDANVGETAKEKEIEETPLDGRDFQDLAFQTAGILRNAPGGSGSNYSINGARADNTNFFLDGFNNRDVKGGGQQVRVPIDAMQEFRVEINTYSAQYGRYGGGVINVVTRNGANQVHGSLFEFLRNDALDARNFFAADKNRLQRNQFGANATGPVFLPHVFDGRNRTFFLFTWESYRQRQDSTELSRVPTLFERQGDFSQSLDATGNPIALSDPLAAGACNRPGQRGCFPGGIVPRSRWNAIAAQILPFFPLPNNDSVNNYRATKSNASDWDSFLGKVDHRFSPRHSLTGRFGRRLADTTNPFSGSPYPQFGDQAHTGETFAGINLTSQVRTTLTNDARVGLVRTAQNTNSFNSNTNYVQQFGLTGVSTSQEFWGFPRFTVRDLGAVGDPSTNPVVFVINSWQAQDSLVWIRSAHTVRFGGEMIRSDYTEDANDNLRGTFNFLGRWTNAPFADFLLGLPNDTTRQVGSYRNYLRNDTFSAFLQDDWRATPSLTLNFGLRYEVYRPPDDKYGRWTNFVPALGEQVVSSVGALPNFNSVVQNAGLTGKVTTARAAGLPSALVYSNPHNLAPRFGFAWRPFGAPRTVLRSGYGIFYTSTNLTQVRNDLGAAFPFLMRQTFTRDPNRPDLLTLNNPFPANTKGATDVSNIFGFDLRPRAAYLQAWTFSIEHQFNSDTVLEISYMGSKGTHLGRRYDINQPFRQAGLGPPFPRPYSDWNSIQFYDFGSNSDYNAALVTLRKRLAGGGLLRLNYTLAKSIDESSQIAGSGNGGYAGAQDARALFLERGRSDWDVRHTVSAVVNYGLPLFPHNHWLGGWRVSSTARIYSGLPFTPQTSNVQLDQGEANRPNRIAFGTVPNPTPDRWFDLAAFPVVPPGSYRFGNSGRNILDGPHTVQINVGLMKAFAVDEKRSFQFRAESFNVPNHPNFDLPNVYVNAVNGGTITSAADGRLIQLALKFLF